MRKAIAIITILLLFGGCVAFAQSGTGQIQGTVTDSTGAVIAGAEVTVTDVARDVTRATTTTSTGRYAVAQLVPGKYKVTITHAGFAILTATVELTVGQVLGFDGKLQIGGAAEVVEVTAGGVTSVNTETQTIQQVITSQQVTELPSLSRDAYSMVGTAGMVTSDPSGRGTGYAINGLRSASTTVMLDGAENLDYFSALYANTVPMDSVQEFSLMTNNFTAEFGRASAGVVNVATKSGTNQFHGSAYEFNRNSIAAANSPSNNATLADAINRGTCKAGDPTCPGTRGHFNRNQFGFSIGGPIKKNKLFFFSNMEWLRIRSAGPRTRWVLGPDMINALPANASQTLSAIGALRSDLSKTSTMTAAQLATLLGSTAANSPNFMAWVAANPNAIALQGVTWTVASDQGGGSPTNNQYNVSRIDWNVSDRTQFYGRFAFDDEKYFVGGGTSSPFKGYDVGQTFRSQNWSANLVHQFSNTFSSQTKLSYNRSFSNQPLGGNPPGPTLYLSSGVPSIGGHRVDFPGYLPEGPGTAIPFGGPQNVYQFNQDFTWVKGKHTFKAGGQYTYMRDNRMFGAYENAVEYLSGTGSGGGSSRVAFENLFKGLVSEYDAAIYPQGKYPCPRTIDQATGVITTQYSTACQVQLPVTFPNFTRHNRYNDVGAYIEDAWKITPRLTLNLGMRWEYYGVQHNDNPNLDSNFYLGSGATLDQQIRNGQVMTTPQSPVGGLWAPDHRGFAPRVGFAWDVFGNGKTALRGGYAISYERNFGNVTYNVIQNPPNYAVLGLTPSDVGSPIYISPSNAGPLGGTGQKYLGAVTLRNPKQNMKQAYAETWNLTVDHELVPNTLVTVTYAGSHGVHEYGMSNMNRVGYGAFLLGDNNPTSRANLQYSSMNMRDDQGFSMYNALNVGVRSNNFHNSGVTLTANYTWSHAMDNLSNTFSEGPNGNYNLGFLDPYMPELDKGNAEFDIRQRLTLSAIWNVPFFDKSSNKLVKHVLGGWEFVPMITLRTGTPFSIFDCTMAYNVCPYYMPVVGQTSGRGAKKPTSLYNPATGDYTNTYAYLALPVDPATGTVAGAGVYGNPLGGLWSGAFGGNGLSDFPICSGLHHTGCVWPANMTQRDAFVGPGARFVDLGIYKNITVTERFKLQFRGEMYNVFNHPNMYVDNGTLDISGNDNIVKSYKDNYRNVQFGLRFTF